MEAKKRVHLICNAHLDPAWLWQWEDGAAEAVSTFRTAAEFCEAERDFVFNHNEALLYRWVEELEPPLFRRIRRLVKAGRWHIAGGSWLQPDLNAPQGESLIRQYLLGLAYFKGKFGRRPTTAYNFDSFGHPAGLPQVLAGCGFDAYLFCRPDPKARRLPAGVFFWRERSGCRVLARRSDDHYLTWGDVRRKLETWLPRYAGEPEILLLWGIGDHGGGVSREEYEAIRAFAAENPQHELIHSTPERYMQAVRERLPEEKIPRLDGEIEDCMPGCYTSSAAVKRAYRGVENLMAQTERLAALAWWRGAAGYPQAELDDAWRDILFTQFHDVLPGSSIPAVERDALAMLGHAETILRRLRLRSAAALLRPQPRAREGEVPLFILNPHAFGVETVVECSYQMALIPAPAGSREVRLRSAGRAVPFQREQPEDNLDIDWRARVAVRLKLAPFEIRRIDASWARRTAPRRRQRRPAAVCGTLGFRSAALEVRVNGRTGLVDRLAGPGGEPLLAGRGSFAPVVFADLAHSWICGDPGLAAGLDGHALMKGRAPGWTAPQGRFLPAAVSPPPAPESAPPVRIIEEGPVRRIIEAALAWGSSRVIQRYILYRDLPYLDVVHRVFWGEKDRMLKIEVPLAFSPQRLVAESLFGAATRAPEAAHVDQTCQRWLAVLAGDRCLAVLNDGSFGCSLSGRRLYLNVLRSCAYACANLRAGDDRRERRYIPRQGQGEQQVTFRLLPGRRFDESAVRRQADILNVPPVWQVYHPSPDRGGPGHSPPPAVPASTRRPSLADTGVPLLEVRPSGVHLVALKRSERGDSLIVRLLETRGRRSRYEVRLDGEAGPVTGRLEPWSLKTLEIGRRSDGSLAVTEVNLVEENPAGPGDADPP